MISTLGSLLMQVLVSMPLLVVWVAGLVFAVRQYQQQKQRSTLLISAFILLIIELFISQGFTVAIPWLFNSYSISALQIGIVSTFISVVTTVLACAAWVLLLIALFRRDMQGKQA